MLLRVLVLHVWQPVCFLLLEPFKFCCNGDIAQLYNVLLHFGLSVWENWFVFIIRGTTAARISCCHCTFWE